MGATGLALSGLTGTATASGAGSPAGEFIDGTSPATTATADGSWSDSGVWDNGVPAAGQTVRIESGVTVTIDGTTEKITNLDVGGTLTFAPDTDSHLRAETIVTRPDSQLHIGTESNPIQQGSEARITFVHHEDIGEKDDPERVSKGLITMGDLEVHGAATTSWDELASAPTAGDTTIELASEPTNWNEGDEIVVPGVDPNSDQDEERAIAGVSGSTVTLDSPLKYGHSPPDHGGDGSLSAYAVNLSRNVVIESEVQVSDPTDEQRVNRQGHVMIRSTNTSVHNARFVHVGRTNKRYYFTNGKYGSVPDSGQFVPDEPNPRKRYALHYHETGIEDSASHEASGLVVQDSPGWGVVNHHSNAVVSNSVTYRVLGAGFVTEGGDERGSFVGNFALRSRGSGQKIDERQAPREAAAAINDFGHAGHGFWLQGPAVAVEDNVAAGHRAYAFSLWNRALYDEDEFDAGDFATHRGQTPNMPRDLAESDGLVSEARTGPANGSAISTAALKFNSVRDNTAFASAGGLDIANHNFVNPHGDESEYSRVEGFTAYNIAPWTDIDGNSDLHQYSGGNTWGEGGYVGISTRYSNNVSIVDATLVNDGGGWGVRRNFYPTSGAVLDSHIEGFDTGIHTIDTGTGHIESVRFDNESVNVEVRPIGHKEGYAIDMADLTFEGGQENVTLAYRPDAFLPQQFAWGDRHDGAAHSYDGRRLYYDAQARDYVPFESEGDIEAVYTDQAYNWSTVGPFDGVDDAKAKVVGKTNEQLKTQYGLCIYDELMPAAGVSHPDITGAKIEPADDENQAPTASFDQETTDLTVRVEATATDSDGAISRYEWAFGDGTTTTGQPVEHTYESAGEYDVTLTVTDDDGATARATQTVSVSSPSEGDQSAYGRDSPWPVPGRIQAEDFDSGGPGVAYSDDDGHNHGGAGYRDTGVDIQARAGGGHNISHMEAGEWLAYTIEVAEAGSYDITANVASDHGNAETELAYTLDGTRLASATVTDTGGWNSYTTVTTEGVALSAGEHVLGVQVADTAGHTYGFDLDWVELTPSGENPPAEKGDGQPIAKAIDEDDDGDIEDTEILDALDYWEDEEPVPGTDGETISDTEILDLVDRWQDEESD